MLLPKPLFGAIGGILCLPIVFFSLDAFSPFLHF
jgi:hypothetical protein